MTRSKASKMKRQRAASTTAVYRYNKNGGKNGGSYDDEDYDYIDDDVMKLADRLRELGNEKYKQFDYGGAAVNYTDSLKAAKTAAAYANRAQAHIKMENFDQAREDARAALALDPDYLKARFRLALALLRVGKRTESEAELEKCCEVEPHDASIKKLKQELELEPVAPPQMPPPVAYGKLHISGDVFNATRKNGGPSTAWHDGEETLLITLDDVEVDGGVPKLRAMLSAQSGAIAEVVLRNVHVSTQLMQFFRSSNRALWQGCSLCCMGLSCSSAQFAELFGGSVFRPLFIRFGAMQHSGMPLSAAIRSLPTIHAVRHIVFSARSNYGTLDDRYADELDAWQEADARRAQARGLRIALDDLMELLHTPCMGTAVQRADGPALPSNTEVERSVYPRQEYSPGGVLQLVAGQPGRVVTIDENCMHSEHGTAGMLRELVDKCKERFKNRSTRPITYTLEVRCRPEVLKLYNKAGQHHYVYNALGEQLDVHEHNVFARPPMHVLFIERSKVRRTTS